MFVKLNSDLYASTVKARTKFKTLISPAITSRVNSAIQMLYKHGHNSHRYDRISVFTNHHGSPTRTNLTHLLIQLCLNFWNTYIKES